MIIHNRIRCKKCDTVIESHHRHDFVWCPCRDEEGDPNGVAVDGGKDYLKRAGNLENYEELSVFDELKTELVEDDDGKKQIEVGEDLILGMDEPLEPPMKVDEEKLTPTEKVLKRQGETIALLKDTLAEYERQGGLVLRYRDAIGEARKLLKKNVLIGPDDEIRRPPGNVTTVFSGHWIAIPQQEYDELKWFLETAGSETPDADD